MSRSAVVAFSFLLGACNSQRPAPTIAFGTECMSGSYGLDGVPRACGVLETSSDPNLNTTLGVDLRGPQLRVGVHNARDGSSVTLGGSRVESYHGEIVAQAPLPVEKLAALTIGQVTNRDPVDLGMSFQLALRGRATATIAVPPITLGQALASDAKRILDGKLGLGASPPAAHSVYFTEPLKQTVIGPAQTLGEVDWFAMSTARPPVEESCDYANAQGALHRLPLRRDVKDVTIYDRRSGAVIDHKEFSALGGCAKAAHANDTIKVEFSQDPRSYVQITDWLTQRIGGGASATRTSTASVPWQTYTSAAGGFTVKLPGKPDVRVQGGLMIASAEFGATAGDDRTALCGVTFMDLPAVNTDAKTVLASSLARHKGSAKVIEDTAIMLDDVPGRSLVVETDVHRKWMRSFLRGKRLFVLTCGGPFDRAATDEPIALEILSSFTLTPAVVAQRRSHAGTTQRKTSTTAEDVF